MNNNSRFSIWEAVKNAYIFVAGEWPYLLRAGLLPMAVQVVGAVFVQLQRPDASLIEAYLWGLPGSMLLGWFVFLQTRLLLLGERYNRLPQDAVYLTDRHLAMKASILLSLLFNMGTAGVLALWMSLDKTDGAGGIMDIAGLFVIGLLIWGVRFGIAPVLAAVHYPIRPVLKRAGGMLFSLRLIGMGLLCTLPVISVFRIIIGLVVPLPEDRTAKLTDGELLALTCVTAPLSFICAALLAAAMAYALKEMLGSDRAGRAL